MKKNVSLMWLAIAALSTVSMLSACSDDDDDTQNGGGVTIDGVDQAEYFRQNIGIFSESDSLTYPLFMTAVDKLKPTEYTYYVEDEKAAEQTFLSWIPEQAQKSVSRDGSTLVYTPRDASGVAQGTITFQTAQSTETATFAVVEFKGVSKIQGIDKIMFQPLSAKPDNGYVVPERLSRSELTLGKWYWEDIGLDSYYTCRTKESNAVYYVATPKIISGKDFLEKVGYKEFSKMAFGIFYYCYTNLYYFQPKAVPYLLKGYKVIVGGSRTEKFQLCEYVTGMKGLTPIMIPKLVDIDESETYLVCQGYVFRGAEDYSYLQ